MTSRLDGSYWSASRPAALIRTSGPQVPIRDETVPNVHYYYFKNVGLVHSSNFPVPKCSSLLRTKIYSTSPEVQTRQAENYKKKIRFTQIEFKL
jgi:hypothetical protein